MSKTLRILGQTYKVSKTKIPVEDGYTYFGDTCHQKHEIRLSRDNCKSQDEETLLHEVLHVVSHRTGAGLTEKQVIAVSNGLLCVMKDNPKWLKT